MSSEQPVSQSEFIASFKGFMDHVVRQAPAPDALIFLQRLCTHFGQTSTQLPLPDRECRQRLIELYA